MCKEKSIKEILAVLLITLYIFSSTMDLVTPEAIGGNAAGVFLTDKKSSSNADTQFCTITAQRKDPESCTLEDWKIEPLELELKFQFKQDQNIINRTRKPDIQIHYSRSERISCGKSNSAANAFITSL